MPDSARRTTCAQMPFHLTRNTRSGPWYIPRVLTDPHETPTTRLRTLLQLPQRRVWHQIGQGVLQRAYNAFAVRVATPSATSEASVGLPGQRRIVPADESSEGELCIEMRIRLYEDGAMSKLLDSLGNVSHDSTPCLANVWSAAFAVGTLGYYRSFPLLVASASNRSRSYGCVAGECRLSGLGYAADAVPRVGLPAVLRSTFSPTAVRR